MDQDWEDRILCSDESCIGVIGPDGRCKECGRPYEGELPGTVSTTPRAAEDEEQRQQDSDIDDHPAPDDETAASDDEWAQRRLCTDENCIGVIGPDGRCKECGKPA
ncbi:hypothetical protein [Desulfatitalea tepidiphila]|uniref:hypothetical protein n=1 Tax=Desulfatitalea tepidiphila TaxID=1185843 RepID=UPI0006B4C518|nr:hypothetical protein [Desulfatitalea tepidiphila]